MKIRKKLGVAFVVVIAVKLSNEVSIENRTLLIPIETFKKLTFVSELWYKQDKPVLERKNGANKEGFWL